MGTHASRLRSLRRPLAGARTQPRSEVACTSIAWAVGVGLVGFALIAGPGSTTISWWVVMFAALYGISSRMRITFSATMTETFSDIFFAAAVVSLPVRHSAVLVALFSLWATLFTRRSLQETIGTNAFVTSSHGAAVLAVWGLAGIGLPRWAFILAGVTLVFVVLRAVELLLFGTVGFATGDLGPSLTQRARHAFARMREGSEGVPHQFLAQAPMSVIGAVAYMVYPWVTVVLIVPFVMSWLAGRQAAQLAEARRRMHVDTLTGLLNRGGFFDSAGRELDAARQYGHPLALIMGDLDNFKRVNDNLGHLSGDEVLRTTAEAFRDVVTSHRHLVGRYGGEEFVVLAVASHAQEVRNLAESIRASVEHRLTEFGTSISLGISYIQDGDRLESLIDRSDKALYSAKFAGKNRVHEWPGNVGRPIAVTAA